MAIRAFSIATRLPACRCRDADHGNFSFPSIAQYPIEGDTPSSSLRGLHESQCRHIHIMFLTSRVLMTQPTLPRNQVDALLNSPIISLCLQSVGTIVAKRVSKMHVTLIRCILSANEKKKFNYSLADR